MAETFLQGKSIPIPEFSTSRKPRTLVAEFGDGYTQRSGDGINTMLRKITLPLNALTQEERDYVSDFLVRHGGYKSFLWSIPGDGVVATKWIATEWEERVVAYGVFDYTITLQQVVI